MAKKIVIQLTVAQSDPERASMAFSIAAAAMASDVPVSFWLAGEAVTLGLKESAPDIAVPYGPDVINVVKQLLNLELMWVCSPCLSRRGITPSQLSPGLKIAGATGFVSELQSDAVALVY